MQRDNDTSVQPQSERDKPSQAMGTARGDPGEVKFYEAAIQAIGDSKKHEINDESISAILAHGRQLPESQDGMPPISMRVYHKKIILQF